MLHVRAERPKMLLLSTIRPALLSADRAPAWRNHVQLSIPFLAARGATASRRIKAGESTGTAESYKQPKVNRDRIPEPHGYKEVTYDSEGLPAFLPGTEGLRPPVQAPRRKLILRLGGIVTARADNGDSVKLGERVSRVLIHMS